MFAAFPPVEGTFRSRQRLWWNFPGLLSWPQVNVPVRVVRSQETGKVRWQLDGKDDTLTSDWIWVTTLPRQSVSTRRAVAFGHQRWDIENHGFHELVNGWHADHNYRHDPNAIEFFLLMAFLACKIFQAFFALNLKPHIRKGRTRAFWSSPMAAEILDGVNLSLSLISSSRTPRPGRSSEIVISRRPCRTVLEPRPDHAPPHHSPLRPFVVAESLHPLSYF